MTDPQDNLMGRAAEVGAKMLAKMEAAALDSPVIGDVRGMGFYLSMEIVKNKETREPADDEGLRTHDADARPRATYRSSAAGTATSSA